MERLVSGHEDYAIGFDETHVWCRNVRTGVVQTNHPKGHHSQITWKLDGRCRLAEDLMRETFPEKDKREWLFLLYRGVGNHRTVEGRTRRRQLAPGVTLEVLNDPQSYCLAVPGTGEQDGKRMRRELQALFPLTPRVIRIVQEFGGKTWEEYYFYSEEHVMCVKLRILDFLERFRGDCEK